MTQCPLFYNNNVSVVVNVDGKNKFLSGVFKRATVQENHFLIDECVPR